MKLLHNFLDMTYIAATRTAHTKYVTPESRSRIVAPLKLRPYGAIQICLLLLLLLLLEYLIPGDKMTKIIVSHWQDYLIGFDSTANRPQSLYYIFSDLFKCGELLIKYSYFTVAVNYAIY